jgi:hypothetical protein
MGVTFTLGNMFPVNSVCVCGLDGLHGVGVTELYVALGILIITRCHI